MQVTSKQLVIAFLNDVSAMVEITDNFHNYGRDFLSCAEF